MKDADSRTCVSIGLLDIQETLVKINGELIPMKSILVM